MSDSTSSVDVTTYSEYRDYMDVGIRELKAKLSQYVERAACGEVIRVTDRGRPRAVLMALPARDRVADGVEEGWIRAPTGRVVADVVPIAPPSGPSTTQILEDDRSS